MAKKILYFSTASPFGIGGGCFAVRAYLKSISEIFDGKVDVLFAKEWEDCEDNSIKLGAVFRTGSRSIARMLFSPFTGEINRFPKPAMKIIKERADEYCCIVSNGTSIGGHIARFARKSRIKMVTIHHNYQPEYFKDNSKGMRKWIELPWVKKLERDAYLNSDLNLFLTEQDRIKFESVYGKCSGKCSVLGVYEFSEYQEPVIQEKPSDKLTFVITGSLCTMQGVDGIRYFFEELYKYLPENCQVIIAGQSPTDEVKSLCDEHKNVTLIPSPKDMTEVISCGDIYICPTRVGGGIKLRVMDGLKLGLPVITHACSARGYDAFYGTDYFKSFDIQEEFKQSLDDLISKIGTINKRDVIECYKDGFSYEAGLARMRKEFSKISL